MVQATLNPNNLDSITPVVNVPNFLRRRGEVCWLILVEVGCPMLKYRQGSEEL